MSYSKEKRREKGREFYAQNRERRCADEKNRVAAILASDQREAYLKNKREKHKQWRDANPEKLAAKRAENAEKRNAARRLRYATDPEYRAKAKADAPRWKERNPEALLNARLRQYGITGADFANILASQGGVCAICGASGSKDVVTEKRSKSGKRRMHVDHCHTTGRVRGILCSSCNLGLGKFSDDADRLERAAAYLRK